ncbi:MAG: helix-turn-helix transcriptional regulator [Candidatus Limnocylindrales bacterium]
MRWEEIREEWLARPGFRETLDREYPYRELALEIGDLRVGLDMTQTEFGRLVGVPQSTVARLESGRQAPSVATLKRIAKATGTELVIEFRRRKRVRPAKSGKTTASSASGERTAKPMAAAANHD